MTPIVAEQMQIDRFFDELQAHIVVAGGMKHSIGYYREMKVGELVNLIWPNGIKLRIDYEKNS